jgi:hypothetical protein
MHTLRVSLRANKINRYNANVLASRTDGLPSRRERKHERGRNRTKEHGRAWQGAGRSRRNGQNGDAQG